MKKAIITGASSGLGKSIGTILRNKKVKVVNLSRTKSNFEDIKTDLTNNENIDNTISLIKKQHSDLDLLILNAGIMPRKKVGKIDFDVDETFSINVNSNIKLVNGLISIIKKNKGDIVIVGSTASFKFFKGYAVYSSTKHAVLAFTKSLQAELKQEKVRVIGFHPGGFNSNLRGGITDKKYMNSKDLAKLLINLLELPRNMQISEIIIDKKKN